MNTLNLVAQIAAVVGAGTLIVVAPLEMFFFAHPAARRFLHVDTRNIDDARMWAFCIGARNLIAGVGVFIGLGMFWAGHDLAGTVVVLTASWYMLLSSLAMGAADLLGFWKPRGGSILGTISSSIPPLVVILAATLWG